jgi:branched-chain amino acid transport system permease protein
MTVGSGNFMRPSQLAVLLLLAGLAAVPFIAGALGEPFWIAFFARVVIYAIAASALNLALGYGGLVSFGHALFLGLGAYAVAIPSFLGVSNGWIHLALCVAATGGTALVTGMISLRTSGVAFIMITLAFAQMGYFLFVSMKAVGGDDGLPINLTSSFGPLNLGSPHAVYWTALGVLLMVMGWFAKLRLAPFGMVLRGSKQNARRIDAMGLQVMRYRLAAYVISGVLCGVAGLLLANLNAFASPSTLTWAVSGELIVILVIGGIATVAGPILGSLAFLGLEEVLKSVTEHWLAVYGLLIVIVSLVWKKGLAGLLRQLDGRRPAPAAPEPAAPAAEMVEDKQ